MAMDNAGLRLSGRRVAVVGLGVSNLPLIRFLLAKGCRVTAMDQKRPEEMGERYASLSEMAAQPGPGSLELRLGPDYLGGLAGFSLVFLTPGMKKNLPEIRQAQERGAEFSSEMNLFFRLCRAPILAVTGSAGKTTTTSLLGAIMRAGGRETHVTGNLGISLIEKVEEIEPGSVVVAELSSFQLQMLDRSPRVGVITNISPNHLDVHASMEEYVEAKKNIFRFQVPEDAAVLNYDNPTVRAMEAECPGRVFFFSRVSEPSKGSFLRGDRLIFRDGEREVTLCRLADIRLQGGHNVENVLAAAAAASVAGVRGEAVASAVASFRGVVHRLELIRELAGVRYFNDSIATAPDRTAAALRTFEEPIVLIAGGYDKKIPFDDLAPLIVSKVKTLLLMGVTADKIETAVIRAAADAGREPPKIIRGRDLEELVSRARDAASPGDVVLLSPACASYDMYRNFEERGEHFRRLVNAL